MYNLSDAWLITINDTVITNSHCFTFLAISTHCISAFLGIASIFELFGVHFFAPVFAILICFASDTPHCVENV